MLPEWLHVTAVYMDAIILKPLPRLHTCHGVNALHQASKCYSAQKHDKHVGVEAPELYPDQSSQYLDRLKTPAKIPDIADSFGHV